MSKQRIKNGASVKWTAPGGGIREYSGTVLGFLPAGANIYEWEMAHGETGLGWVGNNAPVSVKDRYIIQTANGCRVVMAAVLEKQTPKETP